MTQLAWKPVPGAARVGAWCVLVIIWLGAGSSITLDESTYARAGALLTATAGTAVFLPLARGRYSAHWITDLAALGGILYLTNPLETTLSGPWWWYIAAVLFCTTLAALSPLRTRLARGSAVAAIVLLVAAGIKWWAWSSASSSAPVRSQVPFWLLLTMLWLTLAIRRLVPLVRGGPGSGAAAA